MISRFAMAMRWNDTVNMEEMAQVFVDAYITREGFRPAVEIAIEVANISEHVVLTWDINCNPRHRYLFCYTEANALVVARLGNCPVLPVPHLHQGIALHCQSCNTIHHYICTLPVV